MVQLGGIHDLLLVDKVSGKITPEKTIKELIKNNMDLLETKKDGPKIFSDVRVLNQTLNKILSSVTGSGITLTNNER